jgi:hypothetical protein
VSGQLRAPAALPRGKSVRYSLDRSWVGPRVGLDDMEKRKFLTVPGLELRPLGRPACSQTLYRLSYPGFREVDIAFRGEKKNPLHTPVMPVAFRFTRKLHVNSLKVTFGIEWQEFNFAFQDQRDSVRRNTRAWCQITLLPRQVRIIGWISGRPRLKAHKCSKSHLYWAADAREYTELAMVALMTLSAVLGVSAHADISVKRLLSVIERNAATLYRQLGSQLRVLCMKCQVPVSRLKWFNCS